MPRRRAYGRLRGMKSLALLLLLLAMTACWPAQGGFVEAQFELAEKSPLPVWISTLPTGYGRGDVKIYLQYCSTIPTVDNTVLLIKDKYGKTLLKKTGKGATNPEYEKWARQDWPARSHPSYMNITIDGVTEIVEHKKQEPIFYISNQAEVTTTISSRP